MNRHFWTSALHERKAESGYKKGSRNNVLRGQMLAEDCERCRKSEENRSVRRQCDHKSNAQRAESDALQKLATQG